MPMNKPFQWCGRGEEAYNNKAVYSLILNDDLLEQNYVRTQRKKNKYLI
jgi:hypothetical protein